MKRLLLILVFVAFTSCTQHEILEDVCPTGNCDSIFFIDPLTQPDSYQDDNGYYHIKHLGQNYFTIKGELDELSKSKTVNGIPLAETAFDSNYWRLMKYELEGTILRDLRLKLPNYIPFTDFANDQFFVPIIIDFLFLSNPSKLYLRICDIYYDNLTLNNIASYSYNEKVCGACPPEAFNMGTYFKNTYIPQQQFYLDEKMVGDTIDIYVKTKFETDLVDSSEWVLEQFQIIVN
ncbi:hypothetical protein N9R08_01605 [Flavobacteriaceae bacterium]|nr:hypothetical protein [Flavobacteriaceae bacterium]MDB9779257.1 hypothetical protein [Flavobacteriaceae bacterium]